MKFQVNRTCGLYEESWPGVMLLEQEGRFAIGAASVFYQGILDAIAANRYDVIHKRACLNARQKILAHPCALVKNKDNLIFPYLQNRKGAELCASS